jgi:serine/threonine-protein kinase
MSIQDRCRHLRRRALRPCSQGIIHGDIHPRNILVQPESEVTLVDFGLAQLEYAGALNQTPPRAGMPFYFEPECVAASLAGKPLPPATRQSEQYALAALLFSLLTGRFYIEFSLDSWEASIQILQEEPRSFASCGLVPWPELEWVLAHALSKDPAARFASMSEFVEAMRRVCRPPIRVRPHRAPHQF